MYEVCLTLYSCFQVYDCLLVCKINASILYHIYEINISLPCHIIIHHIIHGHIILKEFILERKISIFKGLIWDKKRMGEKFISFLTEGYC